MRNLVLVIVLVCNILSVFAQVKEHPVQGYVIDNFTGENIPDVTVTLLTADSTVVSNTTTYNIPEMPEFTGRYSLNIPAVGKYILKASCIGYKTTYMNIALRSNREHAILPKPIRMVKVVTDLPEVVVRPTKIKMIYSGDTIIYNADAFKVAEGSMLDALIGQLPGTRITKDGQITVNGQFVESLLLNGRDFFNGNPRIALDNLPAYTIGKIKVYHQRDEKSLNSNNGKSPMVMDVHLKKEYATGYLGNAEVGAGTEKRYQVRGIGMKFSDLSRTVAFTNMNNLNDNRRAGYGGEWNPSDMPAGQQTEKSAGINYMYYLDRESSFLTENTFSHSNHDLQTEKYIQTFLPQQESENRNKDFALSKYNNWKTHNQLRLRKEYYWSDSYIDASYQEKHVNNNNQTETWFDSSLLNHLYNLHKADSKTFSLNGSTGHYFRIIADMLRLNATIDYQRSQHTAFSLYDLRYTEGNARSDFRNTYLSTPNHRFNMSLKAGYDYCWGKQSITPSYQYDFQYEKTDNKQYRLDRLPVADSTAWDFLPSNLDDLQSVIDDHNSYLYREKTDNHIFELGYTNVIGGSGHLVISIPFRYATKELNAYRVNDYHVNRRALFTEPMLSLNLYPQNFSASLSLKYRQEMPRLTDMFDYKDDSNPLRIRLGNPDLRNIGHFNADVSAKYNWADTRYLYAKANYHIIRNAIAYGVELDPKTGVTTTTPENINGNWHVSGEMGYFTEMGKRKQFTLEEVFRPSFRHCADFTGINGVTGKTERKVRILALNNELKLTYHPSKSLSIGANTRIDWNLINDDQTTPQNISIFDYNCGMKATLDLPWKMQLTTDVNEYLHRGYQTSSMNTSELIWNASLTKSVAKGKLLFAFKAFDILKQQSIRSYVLNAKGRTETWTNTIPRYFMLSASWRFNKNPKKTR